MGTKTEERKTKKHAKHAASRQQARAGARAHHLRIARQKAARRQRRED